MGDKVFISLDDSENDAKKFKIEDAKNPEKIRERFCLQTAPTVLYLDDDSAKKFEFGKDYLKPGGHYVWQTKLMKWQKANIVQTAVLCSQAVYKDNPHKTLRESFIFYLRTNSGLIH